MITEHHDHMPSEGEFDFSIFDRIFEEFPAHCDIAEENIYPNFEGLELLLNTEAVYTYLHWCLSRKEKFNLPLTAPEDIEKQVTPDFTNPNHVRFLKDAFIDNRIRLKGTLPLSEEEYQNSIKNLKATPQVFRGVVTLKSFLQDYLRCLQERAHSSSLFDTNASDFFQRSLRASFVTLHNGIRAGFVIEFAALVGMGVVEGKTNFPTILHQIFASPNAFQAYSIDEGVKRIHKCPFADTAGQVLTTEFSESGKQKEVSKKVAGGILLAIMQKYESLENKPVPSVKPR